MVKVVKIIYMHMLIVAIPNRNLIISIEYDFHLGHWEMTWMDAVQCTLLCNSLHLGIYSALCQFSLLHLGFEVKYIHFNKSETVIYKHTEHLNGKHVYFSGINYCLSYLSGCSCFFDNVTKWASHRIYESLHSDTFAGISLVFISSKVLIFGISENKINNFTKKKKLI